MTVNEPLLNALNSAFSRKYHSLARYILDANPYLPAGRDGLIPVIETLAAADKLFADRLAEALEALDWVPQLAIFNPEVASLNYLDINYLVAILLRERESELAEFERALALAGDVPAVSQLFTGLIEETRGQLDRLRAAAA